MIFGTLISISIAGASVIYGVEGWSIKKQSIIHYLIMVVTVLPCLIFSGWFKLTNFIDVLVLIGIFSLWGLVIWSVMYFVFTKIIK